MASENDHSNKDGYREREDSARIQQELKVKGQNYNPNERMNSEIARRSMKRIPDSGKH